MAGKAAAQTRPANQAPAQRQAANHGVSPGALSLVQNVLGSSGAPLDSSLRATMESRFGADFSGVRIHADSSAARSANAVSAAAYTSGSQIVFNAGRYRPHDSDGQRLIAHELAHVVQQASGPVPHTRTEEGLGVSSPSDAHEQAAERIAGGMPARTTLGQHLGRAAGLTIQRLQTPPAKQSQQNAPGAPPPQAQQNQPTFPTEPLPYDKWENIEARVTPELGIDFLEIGRIVTVDVKQRLYDFFQPYDTNIVDANQNFASYVNVALAGAGNVPQDPSTASKTPVQGGSVATSATPGYSITGGLGGAIAQVGQIVVNNILDTKAVATAKQRAGLDAEALVGDKLTTDSPIYEGFERDALIDVRHKAEDDWAAQQQRLPPELNPGLSPTVYVRYARRQFGPHSSRVASVISQFKNLLSPYMEKLKKRLDFLQQQAKANRKKAGAIGGAVAGGLIGGAVGLGVGMNIGGWGGLAAGLGIAAGGAGVGALLGMAGADLFETTREKGKDEARGDEKLVEDREKLQTIPEEDADDKDKDKDKK